MIEFVRGVVRDVCDDALDLMELVHDLLPAELSVLEGPLEFGMQRLLDVRELID